MRYSLLFFLLIICASCSKIEPRRPINPKPSTTIYFEAMKQNKVLNELENENNVCHTIINIYYMATQIKRPDTLCFTKVHVHVVRRACKAYMYLITCRIVPK